jgi:hypothetical protein
MYLVVFYVERLLLCGCRVIITPQNKKKKRKIKHMVVGEGRRGRKRDNKIQEIKENNNKRK